MQPVPGNVAADFLRRVAGGLEQVNQLPHGVQVEQSVVGVIPPQFLQRQPVLLDSVAGAVQQGEIVRLIVAIGGRATARPQGFSILPLPIETPS